MSPAIFSLQNSSQFEELLGEILTYGATKKMCAILTNHLFSTYLLKLNVFFDYLCIFEVLKLVNYFAPPTRGSFPLCDSLCPLRALEPVLTDALTVRPCPGIAAATMFMPEKMTEVSESQLRVAFDGDAVLFSDESERIFKAHGLDKFFEHEKENEDTLLDHVGGCFFN